MCVELTAYTNLPSNRESRRSTARHASSLSGAASGALIARSAWNVVGMVNIMDAPKGDGAQARPSTPPGYPTLAIKVWKRG
jgi:hypothetical protein